MAADLVANPKINHTFIHDLESAYYVVFWLSIRLLPNSWNPSKRGSIINTVFNPSTFGGEVTGSKQDWVVSSSVKDSYTFNIHGNEGLSGLIRELSQIFQDRHILLTKLETARRGTTVPRFVARPASSTLVVDDLEREFEELVAKQDHDCIINVFHLSLSHELCTWPEVEPATNQEIGKNARDELCTKSKSLRSYIGKDIGKEGSSQKRLRMD